MGIIRTVYDMKSAGISGIKRGNVRDKINELATNSKNKNIRDLCRGINEFKSFFVHWLYSPRGP
jgi:hypothetical protein